MLNAKPVKKRSGSYPTHSAKKLRGGDIKGFDYAIIPEVYSQFNKGKKNRISTSSRERSIIRQRDYYRKLDPNQNSVTGKLHYSWDS
jgi:hypothetical protein